MNSTLRKKDLSSGYGDKSFFRMIQKALGMQSMVLYILFPEMSVLHADQPCIFVPGILNHLYFPFSNKMIHSLCIPPVPHIPVHSTRNCKALVPALIISFRMGEIRQILRRLFLPSFYTK